MSPCLAKSGRREAGASDFQVRGSARTLCSPASLCLTESEAVLWSALKARQLGVSFRRQVPVTGLFIADFLASSFKLIVEVDGAIHARKPGPDARRDRKLTVDG